MAEMMINTSFIQTEDGVRLALHTYAPKEGQINAVVVLCHGMAEHARRYERFARFLCEHGIAFYAYDQRGHGQTAQTQNDIGFLAEKNGFDHVVLDLRRVIAVARGDYPAARVFLFGHSFGSFVSQGFIERFSGDIAGCVLSGTAGPRRLLAASGHAIAVLVKKCKGARYRSSLLHNLSFGSYLKKIKNAKTESDWLSRDTAQVQAYIDDPLCGFVCTASFFCDLTGGLYRIHNKKNIAGISKKLPLLFIAGTADPVGSYTATIKCLAAQYRANGMEDVSEIYYPEGRHEMLNETNYDEVQNAVLNWITRHR